MADHLNFDVRALRRGMAGVLLGLGFFAFVGEAAADLNCSWRQLTLPPVREVGRISFSQSSPWVTFCSTLAGSSSSRVFRIDRFSGHLEEIQGPPGFHGLPSISGDGARISFSSSEDLTGGNPDGNGEIFLWEEGTPNLVQVTMSSGGNNVSSAISPDGTRILLGSSLDLTGGNPGGNFQIFVYDVASGILEQLTSGPSHGGGLSDDGTTLILGTTADPTGGNPDGNQEIFLEDLASGAVTQVTDTTAGSNFVGAAIGRGEKMVILSDAEELVGPNPNGLTTPFLYDNVSGFQPLLPGSTNPTTAQLSANGHRLVIARDLEVRVIDLPSGTMQILTLPQDVGLAAIDHSGRRIGVRASLDLTGQNPDSDFQAFLLECPGVTLFEDGFESGDTTAWSRTSGLGQL